MVTPIVYERYAPAGMVSAEAVLVIVRSVVAGPTVVTTAAVSGVGSGTGSAAADDVMVAVLVSVAPLWSRPTEATTVKTALPPEVNDPAHGMSAPVGAQVKPPGAEVETNVVPAGSVSETVVAGAFAGPVLVAVMV